MKKFNNQRIFFDLPKEVTVVDVIDDILKNNGLRENDEEYLIKSQKNEDTQLIIVRDAAITIVQKKIPEKKLIELLVKHLKTFHHIAEKIVQDIKQKLIPYAKIVDLTKEKETKQEEYVRYNKESFQEELLNKIRDNKDVSTADEERKPQELYVKKIDIEDVEKNAKDIQKDKKFTDKDKNVIEEKDIKKVESRFAEEKKGPDDYRETVE